MGLCPKPRSTAAGIRASVPTVGFSLGEIFLLIIVGIIVVGPKRLPGMMRTAGQWVSRLRRMSMDLRSQSGIDDLLRQEGLTQHINELRSLSRFNVVETLMAPNAAGSAPPARPPLDTPARLPPRASLPRPTTWKPEPPLREREYPLLGCDAYGCLPDSAVIYLPGASPTGADLPAATEPPAGGSSDASPATEPTASEPAATEPAATELAATEPAVTEPAATEPAATAPAATELAHPAPAPGPTAAEVTS